MHVLALVAFPLFQGGNGRQFALPEVADNAPCNTEGAVSRCSVPNEQATAVCAPQRIGAEQRPAQNAHEQSLLSHVKRDHPPRSGISLIASRRISLIAAWRVSARGPITEQKKRTKIKESRIIPSQPGAGISSCLSHKCGRMCPSHSLGPSPIRSRLSTFSSNT
jgi:hypothetical protein